MPLILTTPPLFQVLPKDLFMPLASRNRQHYWQLLVMLYTRYFGPEADLPPASGWDRREFILAIERLLEDDDPWEPEDGSPFDTSIQGRANTYFSRLTNTGWFLEEKVGLAKVISMPPAVTRFMGDLLAFVDYTPPAVGAKMRSIESALQRVLTSAQPGDDLDEAASQARVLVTSMGSMGLRVREVMRALTAQVTTAEAVRQIFGEYIGKVYMADYAQLAGADHPLARKAAVLALTHEIGLTAHRERLLKWYLDNRTGGHLATAEEQLDRTLRRIKDLSRLQDFLDRLEDDLRRMNSRMLALIDYRLHAPSHLEKRIKRAIVGVKEAESFDLGAPVGPGQLLSGELLAKPRTKRPPIPRAADRQRQLSPMQEARRRLHQQSIKARMVTPNEMKVYLHRVMGQHRQIRASELPIISIKDFRVVQTLSTLALKANTMTARNKGKGMVGNLPKYAFLPAKGSMVQSGYLEMPDFIITKVA